MIGVGDIGPYFRTRDSCLAGARRRAPCGHCGPMGPVNVVDRKSGRRAVRRRIGEILRRASVGCALLCPIWLGWSLQVGHSSKCRQSSPSSSRRTSTKRCCTPRKQRRSLRYRCVSPREFSRRQEHLPSIVRLSQQRWLRSGARRPVFARGCGGCSDTGFRSVGRVGNRHLRHRLRHVAGRATSDGPSCDPHSGGVHTACRRSGSSADRQLVGLRRSAQDWCRGGNKPARDTGPAASVAIADSGRSADPAASAVELGALRADSHRTRQNGETGPIPAPSG